MGYLRNCVLSWSLIQTLLLRSGLESNPGPPKSAGWSKTCKPMIGRLLQILRARSDWTSLCRDQQFELLSSIAPAHPATGMIYDASFFRTHWTAEEAGTSVLLDGAGLAHPSAEPETYLSVVNAAAVVAASTAAASSTTHNAYVAAGVVATTALSAAALASASASLNPSSRIKQNAAKATLATASAAISAAEACGATAMTAKLTMERSASAYADLLAKAKMLATLAAAATVMAATKQSVDMDTPPSNLSSGTGHAAAASADNACRKNGKCTSSLKVAQAQPIGVGTRPQHESRLFVPGVLIRRVARPPGTTSRGRRLRMGKRSSSSDGGEFDGRFSDDEPAESEQSTPQASDSDEDMQIPSDGSSEADTAAAKARLARHNRHNIVRQEKARSLLGDEWDKGVSAALGKHKCDANGDPDDEPGDDDLSSKACKLLEDELEAAIDAAVNLLRCSTVDSMYCDAESITYSRAALRYLLLTRQGPTWVCSSCNELWWRSSLRTMSAKLLNRLATGHECGVECPHDCTTTKHGVTQTFVDFVHTRTEADGPWPQHPVGQSCEADFLFCYTCHRHWSRGTIPPRSRYNLSGFPDIPAGCRDLQGRPFPALFGRLVATILCMGRICQWPLHAGGGQTAGGQYGLSPGGIINVPSDVNSTIAAILPRRPDEMEDIVLRNCESEVLDVAMRRRLEYKTDVYAGPVDVREFQRFVDFISKQEMYTNPAYTMGRVIQWRTAASAMGNISSSPLESQPIVGETPAADGTQVI